MKYIITIFLLITIINNSKANIIDDLLPIISEAESTNRDWVISRDGGYGRYQITAPVLADYNINNKTNYMLMDMLFPQESELVVRWYLDWLNNYLTKYGYKDDNIRILVAYNWGIGNFRKYNFKIPSFFILHRNKVYRNFCQTEIRKRWEREK